MEKNTWRAKFFQWLHRQCKSAEPVTGTRCTKPWYHIGKHVSWSGKQW